MKKLLDFCINNLERLRAKTRAFIAKEDALYYQNKQAFHRRQGNFFFWLVCFICSTGILLVWLVSLWTR